MGRIFKFSGTLLENDKRVSVHGHTHTIADIQSLAAQLSSMSSKISALEKTVAEMKQDPYYGEIKIIDHITGIEYSYKCTKYMDTETFGSLLPYRDQSEVVFTSASGETLILSNDDGDVWCSTFGCALTLANGETQVTMSNSISITEPYYVRRTTGVLYVDGNGNTYSSSKMINNLTFAEAIEQYGDYNYNEDFKSIELTHPTDDIPDYMRIYLHNGVVYFDDGRGGTSLNCADRDYGDPIYGSEKIQLNNEGLYYTDM